MYSCFALILALLKLPLPLTEQDWKDVIASDGERVGTKPGAG